MATDLYIIRHGEAFSNVDGTLGGPKGDKGLTERGFAQARALGKRLERGEIVADVLYASTLLRAYQTAEFVAGALGLPITPDDGLQELYPGEADGMHISAAREQYPQFDRFLHEIYTPLTPGGESWGSFQMRVAATLERITQAYKDQKIVAVAHGGVIEVSFLHLLGLAPQARTRFSFHARNTAITHWRHTEAYGGREEWQLIRHNDDRHLDELADLRA